MGLVDWGMCCCTLAGLQCARHSKPTLTHPPPLLTNSFPTPSAVDSGTRQAVGKYVEKLLTPLWEAKQISKDDFK